MSGSGVFLESRECRRGGRKTRDGNISSMCGSYYKFRRRFITVTHGCTARRLTNIVVLPCQALAPFQEAKKLSTRLGAQGRQWERACTDRSEPPLENLQSTAASA